MHVRRHCVPVAGDEHLAVHGGHRRAGGVVGVAATRCSVRRRERPRVAVDACRWRGRRDVHAVACASTTMPPAVAMRGVDLAVPDLGAVERREPDDQLSVTVAARLVADVGREHAPVAEEPTPVVLGVVGRPLVGGRELADLARVRCPMRWPLRAKMPQPWGGFGWPVSSPAMNHFSPSCRGGRSGSAR